MRTCCIAQGTLTQCSVCKQEGNQKKRGNLPLQRRQWHPTPVLLPGKFHGRRSLVGCSPWGCRVGHDWSDLVAAAEVYARLICFTVQQKLTQYPGANTRDPTPNKAVREKTWRARPIRFSGVFEKASSQDPTHDKVTRRKPDRQGRSGFQGFRKAVPGSHLKDDICLSDACLNGLLPNFSDTDRKAFADLFPNKNQSRTLINKFPRWWYFMRLSRMIGMF